MVNGGVALCKINKECTHRSANAEFVGLWCGPGAVCGPGLFRCPKDSDVTIGVGIGALGTNHIWWKDTSSVLVDVCMFFYSKCELFLWCFTFNKLFFKMGSHHGHLSFPSINPIHWVFWASGEFGTVDGAGTVSEACGLCVRGLMCMLTFTKSECISFGSAETIPPLPLWNYAISFRFFSYVL